MEQPSAPESRKGAPAPPTAPLAATAHRDRGPARWLPGVTLGAVLIVAAILVVALGARDSDDGERAGDARDRSPAKKQARSKRPAEKESANAPPPAAPEEPAPEPVSAGGEESGAALNDQGYELMQSGRYEEAIPILERALAAFPEGTTDINYAYTLYNLGRSLRLVGRFEEAIPLLERRLEWPNQTETVSRELELARTSSTRP